MIIRANKDDLTSVVTLLKDAGLPTDDISDKTIIFAAIEDNEVVGTIGVESYGDIALLRSLAVIKERKTAGLGSKLVQFLETYAKQHAVKELVLLTITAENFFRKRGYQIIRRADVPQAVKESTEFSSTCPSTAIVMKKVLA